MVKFRSSLGIICFEMVKCGTAGSPNYLEHTSLALSGYLCTGDVLVKLGVLMSQDICDRKGVCLSDKSA